jgi:HEAT repeat protein
MKQLLLQAFLPLVVLGFLGCSSGDGEGYLNQLMARLSLGTVRYLAEAESRNLMVRKNAIYYLGEKREEKAVPRLIEFLEPDEPKEIRMSAVVALGKIQLKSSADPLIQILNEGDEDLMDQAIWALGQIKAPAAIPSLADLLGDSSVRLTAIWAMGNIRNRSAVPILTDLLTHENKFVRYNAAQSLKKIGKID